jgi:hypothetical protein
MTPWALWLAACGGGSGKLDDVAFTPGEIPGTGTVTFSTDVEGEARVEFSWQDGEITRRTASFPATDGTVPVYGLPSGQAVEMELVVDDEGKELRSKTIEATIAPPDLQVPPLAVNVWEPELACDPEGHVLFSFLGSQKSGVAIIDRDGNYVWSYGSPDPQQQIGRVRPGRDGESLVWNYADINKDEDIGHIVRLSVDGTEKTETRTLSAHHDFVELPDGKMGFLAYEFRDMIAPEEDQGPVITETSGLAGVLGPHPWLADELELTLQQEQWTLGVASGTFALDTTALPWVITLTQTSPEPATLQGLIELRATSLRLEVVQTEPDLGLTAPTRAQGFGEQALTFRRQVEVAADAIYEVPEGAAETGSEHIVWSAFEDYPQGIYRLPREGFAGAFLPESFEFGHANSLGYVEASDSYLMMWRWLDTLLNVSRDGSLLWQWGGPYSDLLGNDADLFYHGHFSDAWDAGILVFDNRTRDTTSRLVEYTFDDTSFQQVWQLESDKFESVLGDVRRIPIEGCDNLLVSWSGQGRISEITRDGTLVWDVGTTAIGNITSRVYFLPSLEKGGGLYDFSNVGYPE